MLQFFLKKNLKTKKLCEGKGSIFGTILECSICWINYSQIQASKVKMTINFEKTNPSRLKTLITGIRQYVGSFNAHYIIFRNVEIFRKYFFLRKNSICEEIYKIFVNILFYFDMETSNLINLFQWTCVEAGLLLQDSFVWQ